MRILISGGCKNGKSSYAEELAKRMQTNNKNLYYLATMVPKDREDMEKIRRHKKERDGLGFQTVEINRNIQESLKEYSKSDVFLLDSVTALLANEMFKENEEVDLKAYKRVAEDLVRIVENTKHIVIVTDYIHSDAINYECLTKTYIKGLAYIGIVLAKICDVVLESCYTNFITHKGHNLLKSPQIL